MPDFLPTPEQPRSFKSLVYDLEHAVEHETRKDAEDAPPQTIAKASAKVVAARSALLSAYRVLREENEALISGRADARGVDGLISAARGLAVTVAAKRERTRRITELAAIARKTGVPQTEELRRIDAQPVAFDIGDDVDAILAALARIDASRRPSTPQASPKVPRSTPKL